MGRKRSESLDTSSKQVRERKRDLSYPLKTEGVVRIPDELPY